MKFNIFLINLDRSTERLQRASEQIEKTGFKFERVPAVDGATLTDEKIAEVFDAETAKRRFQYDLTAGEIGCYLSHIKCWEKIINDNLDYAVILEDDLLLDRQFASVISTIPQLTSDWHYLKLSCPFKPRPYKATETVMGDDNLDVSLVNYKKSPTGTVAQVVSREGAKRLLAKKPPFFRPIDIDLQWSWEVGITIQGLVPYVADVSDEPSEIQRIAKRKELKQRPFNKLKETIRFKLKH
ncbi:glycosyltransferase family 25 protein [Idiomarina loihiensis]|uniref:glycosyltransferase family 25 protein n=1 Tax=Idiomarina loihiensis TaxID=135577 RepID=UPI0039BDD395